MAIPVHLQQFTAAGIYRVVFDKSQIEGYSASTLRLVVGYSEKGLFNTPVLIKSPSEFIKTFGNISKKLEKRGVFFHRMALQALAAGPILALNLKRLQDGDLYKTVTTPNSDGEGSTTQVVRTLVEGVNALSINVASGAQFPEIGTVKLEDIYNTNRFWNLDPSQLPGTSMKYKGVPTGDAPQTMSNYINIVSTDVKETSNSIFLRKSTIKGYDVSVKDWYSGITDERPDWLTDDSALMSDYMAEVYVFRGKFETSIVQDPVFAKYFEVVEDAEGNETLQLKKYVINAFGEIRDTLDELSKVPQANFIGKYVGSLIPFIKDKTNRYIALDLVFNADNYSHNMMMNLNTDLTENEDFNIDLMKFEYLTKANLDKICAQAGTNPIYTGFTGNSSALLINKIAPAMLKATYNAGQFVYTPASIQYSGVAPIIVISGLPTATGKKIADTKAGGPVSAFGFQLGERYAAAESESGKGGVVYVERIETDDTGIVTVTFSDNIYVSTTGEIVKLLGSLANQYLQFMPTYLEGYVYSDPRPTKLDPESGTYIPSNSQWSRYEWQERLLSALSDYRGMRVALTSKNEIEYRYIVDTFDSFVAEECKAKLSKLASEKENALAILNFPSMNTFANCDYVSFKGNDGKFDISLIPGGGNPNKPRSVLFSLPGATNGDSFAAFYTQVKISDGTVNTICPSAALVSNDFMAKYTTTHPYYIVAGPNYGLITAVGLVGPDYNFAQSELESLEPFGVNCMIYIPKIGTYINADQTAKQKIVSALSKVHVRELVIYIQDEIAKVLQKYHWEFNTQTVRDQIKSRADSICENVKANGGLQAFVNIMDTSNNTPDIIDRQMAVLSTHIEPGMGMGIMVHELTIYRTGEMASSIKTNV